MHVVIVETVILINFSVGLLFFIGLVIGLPLNRHLHLTYATIKDINDQKDSKYPQHDSYSR